MEQVLQETCFPHTADVDMSSAIFTIAPEVLDRLKIPEIDGMFASVRATLCKLRDDRESICSSILIMPLAEGKKILCEVFMGGAIGTHFTAEAKFF